LPLLKINQRADACSSDKGLKSGINSILVS
jgi:hypothetical protein